MKKVIIILVVATALLTVVPMAAFAGGYGGGHHESSTSVTGTKSYPVCPTKSCLLADMHTHNGKTFATNDSNNLTRKHIHCSIEDCVHTGYHNLNHRGGRCH